MKRRINAILAIALLSPSLSWAACDVKSGPKTTALVELYTSEGCSSCPPADKRLSQLPSRDYSLEQVVPISLHVDYWDDLGWKEPFAQPQFSERQSWLVHANGHKTSFTPHFFVSGTEVRDWRGDLGDQLKRVTAEPAHAGIRIHAEATGPGAVSVAASATAPRLRRSIGSVCCAHRRQAYVQRFGRREPRRHLVTRSRRAEMDRPHRIECRSGRFQAGSGHWLELESRAAGRYRVCRESANGPGAASGRRITMPALMKMNGAVRSRSRRPYRFGRS